MNNHLITKSVKLCLYGLMTVCVINIFSNFMQINLMNDYFSNREFEISELCLSSRTNQILPLGIVARI